MKRESVTYRLATSGENDVIGTLAKIAESGEAGAKRTAKAWERDMRTVEAVLERANRSAERLKIIGGSETSRRIAESTGLAQSELGNTKSAEASMAVFIRQQDQLASARQRLMASVDPLAAAQQRYNATMAEAVRLDRQGALAAGDLTRIHAGAKAELDAYSTAQRNGTQMAGAYRAGIQQVGFQVSDFAVQVAGGTSAVRAFALQGPQAVQALALMGSGADSTASKFGKFASFLSGPWGAAILVGTSIAGALATSLFDTGKEADKAKDRTYDFGQSLDFFRLRADEARNAIEQLAEQTKRFIEIEGNFDRQVAANAEKAVADQERRLAAAQRRVERLEGLRWSGPQGAGIYLREIGEARKAVAEAQEALRNARDSMADIGIGASQRAVLDMLEPERARIRALDQEVGVLEQRRRASIEAERLDPRMRNYELRRQGFVYLSEQAYRAELARIEQTRKAIEAARKSAASGSGLYGREIGLSEASSIAQGAGFRVTSGRRTKAQQQWLYDNVRTAQNPVAVPGTSAHERGNALDIAFGPGVTAASIKKAYQEAGVRLTKILKETGHFHIEWSTKGVDKQFREAAEAEKRLAEERERNVQSVRALIEAGDPLVAITNRLNDDLAEIDRLAAASPGQGGIGSEQAENLRQQARDRATFARGEMFNRQNPGYLDAIEEADRRYAEEQRALRAMAEDQRHLNAQLAIEERYLGRSGAERDRQLALLDFITRLEEQGVALTGEQAQELIRGNAALYDRAEALREAQAVMDEQRRIGEDIVDTLFDTRNWDDWGDMGMRIIRMLIQEMLTLAAINPIKNALFGSGLPTLGSGGIGGFLGGLFGGGGGGDALSALFAGSPSDWIAGFASGTEYAPGGWARVGEFGEELVKLPRGAKVLNTGRTRAMERASAGAAPGIGSITINAPGADAAGLRRVEDALRELNASLERRAVTATLRAHQDTHGMMWQG